MKSSKNVIPTIGVLFALVMLYFEGGIWRILSFISVGLGLFGGFAYWLFERAERKAKENSN
jgi:hypothetical protein